MKEVIQTHGKRLLGIIYMFLFLMPGILMAQLTGTYTVGSGGDYATIADAVSALKADGISGAVTFNIKAGTYNEQFVLDAIVGSSSSNTVTFQSQGGVASDVQIYHTASGTADNYVIKIAGASNLLFKNLTLSATGTTYSKVIDITSQSSNISILNDSLTSGSGITSSTNATLILANGVKLSDVTINNNVFKGGGYAIRLAGIYNNLSSNFSITNNRFTNVYSGIYTQYVNTVTISNNLCSVTSGYGIYTDRISGVVQVTKNQLTLNSAYGIYMSNISSGTPPTGTHGLIANNTIQLTTNSGHYGFYISNSTYQDIVFNTINITGSGTSSRAFYVVGTGSNYLVENNIFSNDAGGYAYYASSTGGISTSDFNNLYSTGNYLAYWGSNIRDLSALQTASGKEAHSLSVYSHFVSDSDLHVTSPWLDGSGVDYANISTDIDGEARSSQNPDIGADEFTPAAGTTTPLSGSYTIGSGGDYTTVGDAIDDLMLKGISAPVTYNIKSGTYIEQISMRSIPGSSAADTVTFRSQSGSAQDAIIFYNASGTADNYVWRLIAASHIYFRNLTFQSNNANGAQYGRVLIMSGASGDLDLRNMIIRGSPVNTSSSNHILVFSDNSVIHGFTVQDDSLTGGSVGIRMDGVSNNPNRDVLLKNNRINTSYTGIQLQYITIPVITQNTIWVKSGYAIYMTNFDGNFMVNANYMMPANAYGLYLNNGTGGTPPTGQHGQIYNNAVALNTNSGYIGIQLYNIKNADFVYNSVNMYGSGTSSYGFRLLGTNSSLLMANNIFSNEAGGYAADFNATAGLTSSDYNNFYSSGNYLARWGNSNLRNLDSLQSSSNKEMHSVSVYPNFPSNTDLQTSSPWLDAKGVTFTGLTADITGATRDASTPDIGAYEYTSDPNDTPLSGTYDIGTGLDYETFASAASDLIFRGISGPVTFDVASGTYIGNFTLRDIPGSSATDTVTFRSKTGKLSDVNIYYAASSASDNYVMQLIATNHLRMWNLTMTANNMSNANYGQIVNLVGATGDVGIKHCNLIGSPRNTSSANLSILYSNGAVINNLHLEGDSLKGGSYGLYINGVSNSYSSWMMVKDSYLDTYYYGIYGSYLDTPQIVNNQVIGNVSYPVYLNSVSGTFMITGNMITATTYGLSLYNVTGGKPPIGTHGLVANNFISATGANANRILYLSNCSNIDFYHNSLLVTGSQNTSSTVYVTGSGSENQFVNNIFANKSGGYTYDVNSPALISMGDYNDLYTTGSNIAKWNNNVLTTLADLQSASSMDAHSISANPGFVSNTDLHVTAAALDSVGTPLARVTNDIDGQPRDPNKPDIGADEFVAGSTPIENPPFSNSGAELPKKYTLFQNYPNPFNPTTQIRYGLPQASDVRIEVYNMLGQKIMTLFDGRQSAGYHIVTWRPGDAASGVYFYRLQAGSYVKIMKMLFVK